MSRPRLVLVNPRQAFTGFASNSVTRYPPLGLGYIAALTPQHWDVEILDENFGDVSAEPATLAGITVMTPQAPRAYELARQFRSLGVPVILGGIHPTMVPDEALAHCDAVVAGEADLLWPKVIEDFESGSLQQLYTSSERVNLEKIVFPAHEKFDRRYQWGSLLTTRGCPMSCEFCSVTSFNGLEFRKRPIESVIEEIARIPQKMLFFADDNMAGHSQEDMARFTELCKKMTERRLGKKWITQTSINIAKNQEALQAAKEAGCIALFIGFESVEEQALSEMNKRVNLDFLGDDRLVHNIHARGMAVIGSFIVGTDHDTMTTFSAINNYIKKQRIDIPTLSFMVPFPGTRLEEKLATEQRLNYRELPEDWAVHNIGNRAMVDTPRLQRQELNKEMHRLTRRLYSWPNIALRALRTLVYSRSLFLAGAVLKGNISYRRRHFGASYFTDEKLRVIQHREPVSSDT